MKNKLLLLIFVVSLISSIFLSFTTSSEPGICGTEQGGCASVQDSKYAYTFGIKNSYIGLASFAFLSITIVSHIRKPKKHKKILINTGIIIGSLTALYFLYIQQFVIKEFCGFCLVVDIGMMMALLLIIPRKKQI